MPKLTSTTRISTIGMTRDGWLAVRRKTIGGSDAAAIAGMNPYGSPYSVWAEKTGRLPERPDNEAMRQGRDLEPYVAERFEELTGKATADEHSIIYNEVYPFAHANIDRWIVGEDAGLECKTTSVLNLHKFKNGEYPDQYYAQCVHYMAITGATRWYLAVLVLNQGFYVYEIDRDEAEISTLMALEREFYNRLITDTAPLPDGTNATTDAINAVYTGGNTDITELFGRDNDLDQYVEYKAEIKRIEENMELIKQRIYLDLGDTERGVSDRYSVTWKPQTRSSFDAKRFAADNPDVDLSDYYNAKTFRVFNIKELK